MRLFFYILKEFFKYVVGTIVMTVFLFVLFDFIHKSTKYFAEYQPSTGNVVRYYLFQIPGQINQSLPIAALLASVICMILLSRTNEITAMRAVGMGTFRIGLPLAFGGMVLSILSFLMGEFVQPRFAQRVQHVQKVLIEGEKDELEALDARWTRYGQTLINFGDFDPISRSIVNIRMIDVRPNFRPAYTLEAERGDYDSETGRWKLSGVRAIQFSQNGLIQSVEPRPDVDVELPLQPEKLVRDRRKPGDMALFELGDAIERGRRTGADILQYRVDYHGKIAYPFAAFVVSLIGLKFGFKSERMTETAKGVIIAFFVGISYWFIMSAGRALSLRGDLHPFLAAWLANAAIMLVVAADMFFSRRS